MRAVLLVVLVAMAVLLVAWGVASLSWPYGGDQAWIGWVADVVAGGGRPYVDAWDNNSPGAYLQQAALQATFGHAEWPLRAVDLIYLALTAWALIALGKRYGPSHSGLWASAFFICTYAATGNSNTAQRDGWGAMLVTWALALVGGGGLAGTALAGLLAGLAFLMKPTFALFLVPLLVLLIGTRRSEENTAAAEASVDGSLARLPAGRLIALGVCFLIPLAVVAAWLAPGGGLAEAYRSVVVFNLNAEAGSWAPPIGAHRWGRFVLRLAVLLPALVLAALGLAHILARRTPGRWAIAVIYPAAGFALGALLPGRLSLYHWHAFLAPLALLAGVGIGALSDKASRSTGGRRAATSGLVLALVLGAFAGPAVGTGASVRWWATETLGHGKGEAGARRRRSAKCAPLRGATGPLPRRPHSPRRADTGLGLGAFCLLLRGPPVRHPVRPQLADHP